MLMVQADLALRERHLMDKQSQVAIVGPFLANGALKTTGDFEQAWINGPAATLPMGCITGSR